MKTYKDWICRYYSEHEDGEPDGEIIQELIRCRDCRWFINKECTIYCLSSAHEKTFCSYAEPKEQAE